MLTGGKMKNRTIGPLVFALLLLVSSVLACKGLGGSSSPTATYKAFFDAQKRKDLPGMKKTLSKGSLAMLEQGAKERSEEHTSELQSRPHLVCRLLLEKKKKNITTKNAGNQNKSISS